MASITEQPNGRRMIQFTDANGKRRTVRLGKVTKKQAESTKTHIEQLVSAQITGHVPDDKTSKWVAGLDDTLRDRLAKVGLVEAIQRQSLGAFLESYIESRKDVKRLTRLAWESTIKRLVERFGEGCDLRTISPGDADDWRRSLVVEGLSENTIGKHVKQAKQFFRAAQRKRLIESDPFADLRQTKRPNRERMYFVTREETERVIDACPDAQWRLLVALARYGGLRCPSETLRLTWDCVDWEKQLLTIHSPKTAHHGKASRVIPIFPELMPHLDAVFHQAEDGAEHVITRYRDSTTNLRTQLQRIITRAGLNPWPKLWQNMRSSRQTELSEQFPIHVSCAWLGNTPKVANNHYNQITDDHIAKALQKAQQKVAAPTRKQGNDSSTGGEDTQEMQGLASSCASVLSEKLGPARLELATNGL